MTKDSKSHQDGTFDFLTSCHKSNLMNCNPLIQFICVIWQHDGNIRKANFRQSAGILSLQ